MNEAVELKDGRSVRLRRLRTSDTELFVAYFGGLSAHSRYFFHPFAFDREHAAAEALKASAADGYRLVAVTAEAEDERIVGYGWIDGLQGPELPMLGIGLIDEYHNVGLGRALLTALIRGARELGLKQVRLGVFDDNPRAIHVYESVGFRRDPTKPPRAEGNHLEVYMLLQVDE
jgi:RimJ/RimL family protein N-acetyltransferase